MRHPTRFKVIFQQLKWLYYILVHIMKYLLKVSWHFYALTVKLACKFCSNCLSFVHAMHLQLSFFLILDSICQHPPHRGMILLKLKRPHHPAPQHGFVQWTLCSNIWSSVHEWKKEMLCQKWLLCQKWPAFTKTLKQSSKILFQWIGVNHYTLSVTQWKIDNRKMVNMYFYVGVILEKVIKLHGEKNKQTYFLLIT